MAKHVVGVGIAVSILVTGVVLIMTPFAVGTEGDAIPAGTRAIAAGGGFVALLAIAALGIHLASVIDSARRDPGYADWPADPEAEPVRGRTRQRREAQRPGRARTSDRAGFPEPPGTRGEARPRDFSSPGEAAGEREEDFAGPRLRERHHVVSGS